MGIFGKSFESESKSDVGGGATRHTTTYDDGTSEDWTYNKYGQCVAIDCHDSNGESHSHDVIHGWLGPAKGVRND